MKKILLLTIFAGLIYSQCDTYYADIDGDGDGAKSVWCSYTELPHATGGNWEDSNFETNGCGTVGWNGDTPAGHLTYGPYISTDPGLTSVTWNMLANGDTDNDGTQIATIDIYDSTSGELLAWQDINVNDFNGNMAWQDFSLSYYSSPDHAYEFRTWYTGNGGHLVLRYITHINEDADAQGAYETTTLCDGDDTSGWSLNDDDLMSLCAENSNDDCWDCASEWGGSAVEDECGVCDGLGSVLGYDCEGNDIDECALEIDTCHDNASCYNQGGGYTCICNDGYAGNGQDEDGGCSDINECEATNYGFCVEDAVCINTEGSHYCECFDGYDGDGSSLGTGCTSLCNPNGDANGDMSISVTDLVLIIDSILDGTISAELICSSDVNGDGAVDVVDIVAIIESIIN